MWSVFERTRVPRHLAMSPKAENHRVDAPIPPSRQCLAEDPKPISVEELANEIDTDARRRVTWREGAKET